MVKIREKSIFRRWLVRFPTGSCHLAGDQQIRRHLHWDKNVRVNKTGVGRVKICFNEKLTWLRPVVHQPQIGRRISRKLSDLRCAWNEIRRRHTWNKWGSKTGYSWPSIVKILIFTWSAKTVFGVEFYREWIPLEDIYLICTLHFGDHVTRTQIWKKWELCSVPGSRLSEWLFSS